MGSKSNKNERSLFNTNRSCTDVLFLLLFITFILAHIVLCSLSIAYGDPKRILNPTDYKGDVCGIGNYSDKPYLFTFDIISCAQMGHRIVLSGCPTKQVCVPECPDTDWQWKTLAREEREAGKKLQKKRAKYLICDDAIPQEEIDKLSIEELVDRKICAPYHLKSLSMLNKCLPDVIRFKEDSDWTDTYANITNVEKGNEAFLYFFEISQSFLESIKNIQMTAHIIALGIMCGGILSFIWGFLLRYFAGAFIYSTIACFNIIFFAFTGFAWYWYHRLINNGDDKNFTVDMEILKYSEDFWLCIAILCTVLTVFLFVMFIYLRTKINLAVALIEESTKALDIGITSMVFQFITFLFQLGLYILWVFITIQIASVNRRQFSEVPKDQFDPAYNETCTFEKTNIYNFHCHFVKYVNSDYYILFHMFNTFITLWLVYFLESFTYLVMALAMSNWFFRKQTNENSRGSLLLKSIKTAALYHLGTLAIGSFLLATLNFIRICLQFLYQKTQAYKNAFMKFVMKMLICCFCCLEKVLKYISKKAYIMTAVHGTSFCASAKDVFVLISKHCLSLFIVDGVIDFVFLMAKLVVTGIVSLTAYFMFQHDIEYYYKPLIIIIIGTYIIASLFFEVLNFSVETLFICVMEDLDKNDGSPERPYCMSKDLMMVLDVKNDKC